MTFQQRENESDGDYFQRVEDYKELLSEYHFKYYDHQLPARTDEPVEEFDKGQEIIEENNETAITPEKSASTAVWRSILMAGLGNYYTDRVAQGVIHNVIWFVSTGTAIGLAAAGGGDAALILIPAGISLVNTTVSAISAGVQAGK